MIHFIPLTPCYQAFIGGEQTWARRGTIHLNPHYIVSITYTIDTGRANVILHDGTTWIVPIAQIAALIGLELA